MTVKELQARVDRLIPRPVMVLCKLPDGSEVELTASEYLQDAEADFVRITSGNNLRQVKMILDKMTGSECAIESEV